MFVMDSISKSDILNEIIREKQFLRNDEEEYEKYNELQEIVEKIDLSILETSDGESTSLPSPKRRKTGRSGSENTDVEKHEKEVEAATKQIELVKKALAIIYDVESTSFKKFISKHGKKPRKVVSRVPFIKRINDNGETIPLWIGREDESPPELCGAIPADKNYVTEIGGLVAALVKLDKKENWILAEVVAYDANKKEYKVDDIYEESKGEIAVSSDKVIPLPKLRADPEVNPEFFFPKNSLVLALYPGTTCFYPAIVGDLPAKAQDPYKLLFEDKNYESGYSTPITVPQRYVIPYDVSYGEEVKTVEIN